MCTPESRQVFTSYRGGLGRIYRRDVESDGAAKAAARIAELL